ncbi:TonB-dependent siderophore receptor [Agrobacterium rosae]|uniref:TonB-dependent siderophore receptor n=1 Tax=Agrobacterium rosae TaxID=1972867 RepID=UPI000CD97F7D|nr:TonB-dependent siderophore receptor [Agrobacterium rosae]POO50678.1 TonB-dependent siderophore receptor [Agrobacterium rosae]
MVQLSGNGRKTNGKRKALITTLMMSTSIGLGIGVTARTAFAQAAAQTNFSINAGPLNQALMTFGRQTGLQITYLASIAAGKSSPGFSGNATREHALASILKGSGLTYSFPNATTVAIAASGPLASGANVSIDGSTVLETIIVDGATNGVNSFVVANSSSGTKTNAPLVEVPQSISVVGRKQIDAQNAQSVSEILRYVPGVTIETYGPDPKGYDWIMMRGFNAQSTSSYLDGLRQISSGYSFFRTDPYQLQSVEVLRGPSSSLYGQSDAGGIVNKISKKPTDTPVREVEVEYGSNQRAQVGFDLGGPVNDDKSVMYRVTGVARNSNTQFQYSDGTDIGDDRLMIAPSVTWAPDSDTSLTVTGQALRDKSGGTVLMFTPTNTLIGDHTFNKSVQEQGTIGYEFSHRFSDTWTVRQNLRYGHAEFKLDNLLATGMDAFGNLIRGTRRFDESLDALTIDNQAQANFDTGAFAHELLLGLDYARSDADVKRYSGSAPSLNPNNPVYGVGIPQPTTAFANYKEKYQQIGLYAQDRINLTDNLIATIGGRYDWVDIDTNNRLSSTNSSLDVGNFSGRAGLSYKTPWGLVPYVSYAESFVPNTGVSSSGTGFDPSTGRQWEVGVKYEPVGIDALFTVAWFDIVKSNVLTPERNGAGALTNFFVATGEVQSRGVELEGKFSIANGWDLTSSYTWTDAEITKDNSGFVGKTPYLVPEHQASAWLNYTVYDGVLEGLSIGGGVRYVGDSFGDNANTVKVDGRTLLDLGASYKVGDNATVSLNATNVFDKKYYTTCEDSMSCYEGDRRSVIGRLKVNF